MFFFLIPSVLQESRRDITQSFALVFKVLLVTLVRENFFLFFYRLPSFKRTFFNLKLSIKQFKGNVWEFESFNISR